MTLVGSYGLLHFLRPGYISGNTAQGRAGYTYLLTPRDSIGLTYDYALMRFTGAASSTQNHLVQLSFAHTLAGRWSFQLAGGPQFLLLENSGFSSGGRWTWSATSSLAYLTHHNGLSLGYFHGITGGSGVILGAETDALTGSISRSLARWLGSLNSGYTRNATLVASGSSAQFNSWFAGAHLARPLGRHFRVGLNYSYQQQTGTGSCPVLSCGLSTARNVGSLSLEWHPLGVRTE
jgi:hypothetical protein